MSTRTKAIETNGTRFFRYFGLFVQWKGKALLYRIHMRFCIVVSFLDIVVVSLLLSMLHDIQLIALNMVRLNKECVKSGEYIATKYFLKITLSNKMQRSYILCKIVVVPVYFFVVAKSVDFSFEVNSNHGEAQA